MSTITNQTQLENHKMLVRKWVEDSDAGEKDFVDKYADPEIIVHYPGGVEVRGIDELNKSSKNFQIGFPDGNHKVELQVAENDLVTTRITITGTHLGEFMGVPATGNKLEMTMIEICRFKNGKLIEVWIEFDSKAIDKVLTNQLNNS
jgi:predicted ester cyclase